MKKKFLNMKGQSVVEVVIALGVAIIVIVALARVTVTSIHNAGFAKNRALATKYAQEWIEEARKLRDEQGEDFFVEGNGCSFSETGVGIFDRSRICSLLVEGDKKTMSVMVKVEWTDAAGSHESKLETRLTNWK